MRAQWAVELALILAVAGALAALRYRAGGGLRAFSGRVLLMDAAILTAPRPAAGARVSVCRLDGSTVSTVEADAQGHFTLWASATAAGDVIVDGPDLVPTIQRRPRPGEDRPWGADREDAVVYGVPAMVDARSDVILKTLSGIIFDPDVGIERDRSEGKVLGLVVDDARHGIVGATVRLESQDPILARRRAQGNLYVAPTVDYAGYKGFFIIDNVPPGPIRLVTSDFPASRSAHARVLIDPVDAVARPGAVTALVLHATPNPWRPGPDEMTAPVRFERADWSRGYRNESRNIDPEASLALGSGVAIGDLDGDGRLDIVATGGLGYPDASLLQESPGRFRMAATGLELPGPEKVAVALGDVDNDGNVDAYIGALGRSFLLTGDGKGHFTDVTRSSYVADHGNARTVAMADLDGDGRLDLFCGNYDLGSHVNMDRLDNRGQGNTLHHNLGQTRFEEVSEKAGIHWTGLVYASAFVDLDGDGLDDLILAHDHGRLRLYMNRTRRRIGGTGTPAVSSSATPAGPGTAVPAPISAPAPTSATAAAPGAVRAIAPAVPASIRFEEVTTAAGLTGTGSWMGIAVGDYDNDGRLDFFVTNTGPAEPMYDPIAPESNFDNALLHNDGLRNGIPHFTDVAREAGVADTGWGWGCCFEDLDNDGWLDLVVVTNMFIGGIGGMGGETSFIGLTPRGGIGGTRGFVFFNDGHGHFRTATRSSGIDIPFDGRAVCAPDLDGDGWPDLVCGTERGPLLTYRNRGGTNAWIEIEPRGDGIVVNRSAIGAIVRLSYAGGRQMRVRMAGEGFKTCASPVLHFGLGTHREPVAITIAWPGGFTTHEEGLEPCRKYVITFGR